MENRPTEELGQIFLKMHSASRGFVLPNAWDAGSAVMLASEGFAAIGTTSAGIAFSRGKPDHGVGDSSLVMERNEILDAVRNIVRSVDVPVSADLESGYGDSAHAVGETVRQVIELGAVGCNIEDVDPVTGTLFPMGVSADRVAAARRAIHASGRTFVLNARTDGVLKGSNAGLQEAIRRGNAYLQAGADCVFVPGVTAVEDARLLVRSVRGPVNLVLGLNEAGASAFALLDVGVQRISVGGSIARSALGLVRRSARELKERGTVTYAREQVPHAELNQLFMDARMAMHDRKASPEGRTE